MKELSVEQKARRYDEAIKLVNSKWHYKNQPCVIDVSELFPELKDEDETIRKELIDFVKSRLAGFPECDRFIAWLEKQGEQKPIIEMKSPEESLGIDSDTYNKIVDACIYDEQKTDDKVEPKFHEGDWVILTAGELSTTLQIVDVDTNKKLYWFNDSTYLPIVDEECLHHWTIQDAKEGDVLYSLDSKQPFIFKHRKPNEQAKVYCGINIYGKFFVGNTKDCIITTDKYIPATKEQRNTLERAMDDAGYTFDFESKELKEIEPIPAWSKEDEAKFEEAICMIESNGKWVRGENAVKQLSSWLKSLKDRVQTLAKIEKGIK